MRLKDYIQGNRRGKEANRLEREAMNDPFLQEALDGFDAVAGDHSQVIERLERKFTRPAINHHRNRRLMYWSAAASILLLLGMSAYFFLQRTEKTIPLIAMNQLNENENIVTDDSMASQPVQVKESLNEMPVVAQTPQKILAKTLEPEILSALSDEYIVDIEADFEVSEINIVADEVAMNHFETSAKSLPMSVQKKPAARGKVVDETGAPIPGVTIVATGTNTGTTTDVNGFFAMQVATDSSKLLASFIGYETHEIKPSGEEQTVMLKPSDATLSEAVIVAYGSQKRRSLTGSVSKSTVQNQFGEKEFQNYCQQNGNKIICGGKPVFIKLSFSIDENGKPADISYKKYSCEDAKKEMEKLLSSSPAWTVTNRKISMTVEW